MIFEKVNLSAIQAIAHDGKNLQILIECEGKFRVEGLPAPEQAFRGIQQLARFAMLTLQESDRSVVKQRLLEEIDMIPVDSSNIAAIGYSDALRILQVDFLTGSRYRYFDVPSQVFQGFLVAPSKGQYLNQVVKADGFDYSQVR